MKGRLPLRGGGKRRQDDRIRRRYASAPALDVQFLLGRSSAPEHEHHADDQGAQQPELHPPDVPQEHRRAAAHGVAEALKTRAPSNAADRVHQQEAEQRHSVSPQNTMLAALVP